MKIIVLILITFSTFAQNPVDSMVDDLMQINSSGINLQAGLPNADCPLCRPDFDEKELDRCARALCGRPARTSSSFLNNSNFNDYVDRSTRREFRRIKPGIRRYVKAVIEKQKEFFTNLKELVEQNKLEQTINNNAMLADRFAHKIFDSLFDLTIDSSRPSDQRISISYNTAFDQLSPTVQNTVRTYAAQKSQGIRENPGNAIQQGFYNQSEAQAMVAAKIEEAKKLYNEMEDPGVSLQRDIGKLNEFDEINTTDMEELSNLFSRASFVIEKASGAPAPTYTPECDDQCRAGLVSFLNEANLGELANQTLARMNRFGFKREMILGCEANFLYNSLLENHIEQEQQLASLWPNVVSLFKTRFMSRFSAQSQNRFNQYLDQELQFEVSTNRFPINENLFENPITSAINLEQSTVDGHPSETLHSILDYFSTDLVGFSADFDICTVKSHNVLSDAYGPGNLDDPSTDRIIASIYSGTYPTQGQSLLSHELGHALSYQFKRGILSDESAVKFQTIRNCSSSFHLNQIQDDQIGFTHPNDHLYTEEDMADLVSFAINRDQKELMGCGILKIDERGRHYESLSVENPIITDPHSSSFLRLLREAVYKKENMPRSCQKIIDAYSEQFNFTPCL